MTQTFEATTRPSLFPGVSVGADDATSRAVTAEHGSATTMGVLPARHPASVFAPPLSYKSSEEPTRRLELRVHATGVLHNVPICTNGKCPTYKRVSIHIETARDRLVSANPLGEPGHNERPDYPCTFEHYVDKGLNLVCLRQESLPIPRLPNVGSSPERGKPGSGVMSGELV